MSILTELKDKLTNIKLNIVKYLTPLNYTEYCMKMLYILEPEHIKSLLIYDGCIHMLLILTSILMETFVSTLGLLLSLCYTILALGGIYYWRVRVKKKPKIIHKDGKINFKSINIENFRVPDRLAELMDLKQEGVGLQTENVDEFEFKPEPVKEKATSTDKVFGKDVDIFKDYMS